MVATFTGHNYEAIVVEVVLAAASIIFLSLTLWLTRRAMFTSTVIILPVVCIYSIWIYSMIYGM